MDIKKLLKAIGISIGLLLCIVAVVAILGYLLINYTLVVMIVLSITVLPGITAMTYWELNNSR